MIQNNVVYLLHSNIVICGGAFWIKKGAKIVDNLICGSFGMIQFEKYSKVKIAK